MLRKDAVMHAALLARFDKPASRRQQLVSSCVERVSTGSLTAAVHNQQTITAECPVQHRSQARGMQLPLTRALIPPVLGNVHRFVSDHAAQGYTWGFGEGEGEGRPM